MPKLDDYKTQHLFLLIGGNPLPNYVAAKLMAKRDGIKPTLHLVFSQGNKGTEEYAGNLRKVLGENNYEIKDLPIDPSNQSDIYKKIKNRVESVIKNGATSIGINYTGGTKAMAVHGHRAVKDVIDELNKNRTEKIKPVFSYLDSREMKICVDQETNANRIEFELYDIGSEYFYEINLHIEELLKLHGLEKKRNFRRFVEHSAIMKAIYEEITNNLEEWEKFRRKLSRIKDSQVFSEGYQVSLEGLSFLPYVLQGLNLVENNQLNSTKFFSNLEAKNFRDYIIGKWLEDFVLERVLQLKQSHNQELGECGASLEIKHPKNSSLPYFETDCFVIRGYQLFLISCSYITTNKQLKDKKNPYKQKIFEVLSRAEQIGGSEARVALVCMASNLENHKGQTVDLVKTLEEELDDERVVVFGMEDILNEGRFTNKLSEWFEKR